MASREKKTRQGGEPMEEKQNGRGSVSKTLVFAAGVVFGFLTAPKTGRAARAWISQKAEHYRKNIQNMERRAEQKTSYEEGRLAGVIHKAKQLTLVESDEEEVDNDIITQRVRTNFGENLKTSHLPRINVDTVNGLVTLRGRVPTESDRRNLEQIAKTISDVEQVVNKVTVSRKKAAG